MKGDWAHLMYHIDEGLSCVPVKIANHLDLILSRENIIDQRDELMRSEDTSSQAYAGRHFSLDEGRWTGDRAVR